MSNSLFTLGVAKNSSDSRGEEGTHFVTMKHSSGTQYRILNIDSEIYAPKSGIVEIEPLKNAKTNSGAMRHVNHVQWKCIRDKETGYLVGIPVGFDKEGNLKWRPLNVTGMETYDLSIPDQRAKWICVKYSHFYTKSPNFSGQSKTKYKAIDREREAKEFAVAVRTKRKAEDFAMALVGDELEDIGLMLGFEPKLMSPTTLWAEVVKFAQNPDKINGKTGADRFMEVYDSPTREQFSILKKGLSTGILSQTLEAGINYSGLTLGFNDHEATRYLKDHPAIAVSISAQAHAKMEGTEEAMRPEAKQVIKDEKDAENARLRAELEAMKKQLASVTGEALEVKAEADLAEVDPEFAELRAQAKELKVPGWQFMKDKEKLKKGIGIAQATNNN